MLESEHGKTERSTDLNVRTELTKLQKIQFFTLKISKITKTRSVRRNFSLFQYRQQFKKHISVEFVVRFSFLWSKNPLKSSKSLYFFVFFRRFWIFFTVFELVFCVRHRNTFCVLRSAFQHNMPTLEMTCCEFTQKMLLLKTDNSGKTTL